MHETILSSPVAYPTVFVRPDAKTAEADTVCCCLSSIVVDDLVVHYASSFVQMLTLLH